MDLKRCSSCGESKERTAFYRRTSARDGLRSACKTCVLGAQRSAYEPVPRRPAMTNAEKSRRYKERHPDRVKQQARSWQGRNRDRVNAANAARRAKTKTNCPRVAALYAVAASMRAEGRDVHVDHIVPIARGGLHVFENLQILPAEINLRKGDKLT